MISDKFDSNPSYFVYQLMSGWHLDVRILFMYLRVMLDVDLECLFTYSNNIILTSVVKVSLREIHA